VTTLLLLLAGATIGAGLNVLWRFSWDNFLISRERDEDDP
jgi:hypothetical protein